MAVSTFSVHLLAYVLDRELLVHLIIPVTKLCILYLDLASSLLQLHRKLCFLSRELFFLGVYFGFDNVFGWHFEMFSRDAGLYLGFVDMEFKCLRKYKRIYQLL